jgi:uncharacterized membrane protein
VTERRLRFAVTILALAGAGVSSYLTYVRATGGSYACTTGGCETVQSSSYAEVAGIPVAVIGLVGYLAIGATALFAGEAAAVLGAALALGGFAFSVYLLYLQLAVIDAICVWCVASEAAMTVLFALTLLRLLVVSRAHAADAGSSASV